MSWIMEAAELTRAHRDDLMGRVGRVFHRREPRLQSGKYVQALSADLPRKNGWQIAEHAGDATPDKTQRLLNHAASSTSVGRACEAAGPVFTRPPRDASLKRPKP